MNFRKDLETALLYNQYVNLLGDNLSLHNLHYKNFKLNREDEERIARYSPYDILIITEPWCGDSLALFPLIKKISECNSTWNINILLRDKNLDIIDKFLTNGVRAIPKFIFLNKKGDYIFDWGPRPVKAQEIFEQFRERINKGEIEKKDVILKIRKYYAKDKGKETSNELLSKIYSKLN